METTHDDPTLDTARNRVGLVLRDKWHLDRFLGMGGMAAVYAATHRNGNRVAIKVLHPEYAAMPEARKRFMREGYAANRVQHPGAVKVLDDDATDDGGVFLVMELLQGESVETRWERKGRKLDIAEVIFIADGLLDVLAAAHEKGIVHRDIKPDNIFISSDKAIKLLDFGIAAIRELASSNASKLTRAGSAMGTPAFMAPEQAMGRVEQVDAQTDIWSVGASLFTLLSGHWVHEADTDNLVFVAAATQRARSIATVMSGLPTDLVSIVDCALSFEKAGRWGNASAMQSALREAARSLSLDLKEIDAPPSAGDASSIAEALTLSTNASNPTGPSLGRVPSLNLDSAPKPPQASLDRDKGPKDGIGAGDIPLPSAQPLDFHLSHEEFDEPAQKLELWLDHYPAGQPGMGNELNQGLSPRIRPARAVSVHRADPATMRRAKRLLIRAAWIIVVIGVLRFALAIVNDHFKLFNLW